MSPTREKLNRRELGERIVLVMSNTVCSGTKDRQVYLLPIIKRLVLLGFFVCFGVFVFVFPQFYRLKLGPQER